MMSFLWIIAIISMCAANANAWTLNPTTTTESSAELIIYEDKTVTDNEKKITLTESNFNFGFLDWGNDEASSVQAVKGTWILYSHKYYTGYTLLVTKGERISEAEYGQDFKNDKYSSAKLVSSAIILYENSDDKDGKTLALGEATPNFGWLNWGDDKASSVQAVIGNWELYEHANYKGDRMFVTEGERINVANNDHYSSARPVCTYKNDPATAKIRVFEDQEEQGAYTDFFRDHANLANEDENWNDRISSIRVYEGQWELYKNADYKGDRIVVNKGDQKNVNNDHYSSLRPVCETYSPTPEECKLTDVTVQNNPNMAQKDDSGIQIVGLIVDSSCAGVAIGHLLMDRTDSIEESVGIETAKDTEFNWYVSASVTVALENGILGFKAVTEMSVEAGVGGSYTYSTSKSTSTTSAYSQSVGFEFEYATPAVAVLFGSVDKYVIDASEVPIINHYTCPDGLKNVTSTASLKATTYQSADYWYLFKDLPQDVCDAHYKEIYMCMRQFKEDYSSKFAARDTVKAAFEACFNFDTTAASTEAPL